MIIFLGSSDGPLGPLGARQCAAAAPAATTTWVETHVVDVGDEITHLKRA